MATSGIKSRAGYLGRVQAAGVNLKLQKWSVKDHSEDQDTTNFESGGYIEGIGGVTGADVSFSGDWDAGKNPYDNPPALIPGTVIANCYLYINKLETQYYLFGGLRIIDCTVETQVPGKATYSVNAKSDGTFTRPTGSV